jgi:hypothetical protein
MPLVRRWRPLKRWRYVGVFGPELMLCVGIARIGPIVQRWWAVAEPDGALRERTSMRSSGVRLDGPRVEVVDRGVAISLELEEDGGVEVVSPSGASGYIWTRKRAGVGVRGTVRLDSHQRRIEGEAFVDDSAGYHERHTWWRWSAGLGRGGGGERLAWNLVTGIHDAPTDSERTVWVDGRAMEVGPVRIADDLSRISFEDGGALDFSKWATRREDANLLLFRSSYLQPFGTFSGTLPGGLLVAEGYGVMEEHDVWW